MDPPRLFSRIFLGDGSLLIFLHTLHPLCLFRFIPCGKVFLREHGRLSGKVNRALRLPEHLLILRISLMRHYNDLIPLLFNLAFPQSEAITIIQLNKLFFLFDHENWCATMAARFRIAPSPFLLHRIQRALLWMDDK
jgi:hypothetical protein